MKKTLLLTILFFLLKHEASYSQNEKNMNAATASAAFAAWGEGEKTGNYEGFKKLLAPRFHTYSHPLDGNFTGKQALEKLLTLIADREKKSNQLSFSNIKIMDNGDDFAFSFDSQGQVAGGYPYKGFNIIVISVSSNRVVGFREYFGFVDPAWFK